MAIFAPGATTRLCSRAPNMGNTKQNHDPLHQNGRIAGQNDLDDERRSGRARIWWHGCRERGGRHRCRGPLLGIAREHARRQARSPLRGIAAMRYVCESNQQNVQPTWPSHATRSSPRLAQLALGSRVPLVGAVGDNVAVVGHRQRRHTVRLCGHVLCMAFGCAAALGELRLEQLPQPKPIWL